jgi:hypothetical protein
MPVIVIDSVDSVETLVQNIDEEWQSLLQQIK